MTCGATPLDYAAWRESTLGRITEHLERAVVFDLAGSVDGLDVLDVGAGNGAYALALAGRGARVTGLDASLSTLRAVAAQPLDSGTSPMLVAGDALALPFDDARFDVAIAVTVLCFLHSPQQALSEVARVLRPGGRLILGELGRWSVWAAWRRVRGWLGAGTWRGATFWTTTGLRELARGAGLVPGRVRGAVFHPPLGLVAGALAPIDPLLGRATTLGAAFLAMDSEKPPHRPGLDISTQ